jgi:transposase InsO family protein
MCVGPMSRKSLSGCEYYLTFIDDYSRKTWIYFLKAKSMVFARFQEFRALVENQSGKRIKVLRSDNGGEYSSRQFVDFLCPAWHQERDDRTIQPPSRTGLLRGRTGLLLVQRELCCMIRVCLCTYGQRHVVLQFICRTGVPIGFWGR